MNTNSKEKYTVEYPSDEEIRKTIDIVSQYVTPTSKEPLHKKLISVASEYSSIIKKQLLYINLSYWVFSILIWLTGIFVITYNTHLQTIDIYLITLLFAPISFILGILEIQKDSAMYEIEMSCKYSYTQVITSRITLIALYSLFLNVFLSILLSVRNPNIIFWKVTLTWLSPLTFLSSITMFLSCKIRSRYSCIIIITIWTTLILSMTATPVILDVIMPYHLPILLLVLCLGIVTFIKEINSYINNNINTERREHIETNY